MRTRVRKCAYCIHIDMYICTFADALPQIYFPIVEPCPTYGCAFVSSSLTTMNSHCVLSQMFGPVVTSFIEKLDYKDVDVHRAQTSKMDLADIVPTLGMRSDAPQASRNEPFEMDIDSDTEVGPSDTPRAQSPMSNVVQDPTTRFYMLGISKGTPTS